MSDKSRKERWGKWQLAPSRVPRDLGTYQYVDADGDEYTMQQMRRVCTDEARMLVDNLGIRMFRKKLR